MALYLVYFEGYFGVRSFALAKGADKQEALEALHAILPTDLKNNVTIRETTPDGSAWKVPASYIVDAYHSSAPRMIELNEALMPATNASIISIGFT